MAAVSRGQAKLPNPGGVKTDTDSVADDTTSVTGDRGFYAYQERLRRLIREIWPQKTIQNLALVADIPLRQAARILAREQHASGAVIWNLNNSLHGERFLQLQMAHCAWPWWHEREQEHERAVIRRQKRELEERLKKLDGES